MTVLTLPYGVCREEVRRYLGFKRGKTKEWGIVESLIDQMIEGSTDFVSPSGLRETFSLDSCTLPEIAALYSFPDVALLLHNAQRVSLLAVTLGPKIDEEISCLFERGKYAEAAILDAIGSAAAEQSIEDLYTRLHSEARSQGFSLSRRFSPGYTSFPLSYQKTLCHLVGAGKIGIAVNSHSILLPRKSVTAIVAWIPGEVDTHQDVSACEGCTEQDCLYRRLVRNPEEEKNHE